MRPAVSVRDMLTSRSDKRYVSPGVIKFSVMVLESVFHRERIAWALAVTPMLFREQAHDEARRAVTTLRAAGSSHCLLHLGQDPVSCQRFDRVELTVGSRRKQHQAAVDDTIGGAALLLGNHRHGAGAALTFGASFLGPRQPARSDEVEQRYLRRVLTDMNVAAVQDD